MSFEIINNALCIITNEKVLISDITGYMKYPGKDANVLTVNASGAWTTDGKTASCDNLTFEMSSCGE